MKTKIILEDIYPLTVIADRYNGTYSGGKYLAFNIDFWDLPEPIGSGDMEEMYFWQNTDIICGLGNTPNDAIVDLYIKLNNKTNEN